jgi:Protein of unknown function (DUF3108)
MPSPSPRSRRTLLCAAALFAVLIPRGSAVAGEAAFGPAEAIEYRCKFLGIPVGRGQVVVGSETPVNGRTVWPIVAFARTDPVFVFYPVRDKFVTWWNPATGLTEGNDLVADEKSRVRRERLRFDRDCNKAIVIRESDGGRRQEATAEVAPGSQDILAAVFALRGRPLRVGDHEELPLYTGSQQLTLRADVDRQETVEVPAGKFEVVVLKVKAGFTGNFDSKREMRFYVTDDVRHLPVRIDADFAMGSLVLDLESYQAGLPRR